MNQETYLQRSFTQRVCDEALASSAVNHPYLTALVAGDLPNIDLALKDLAVQYGLYSKGFVGYVSAVINALDDPRHRRILNENLAEENGEDSDNHHGVDLPADIVASIKGQPHAALYDLFLAALGVDVRSAFAREQPSSAPGAVWRRQFERLCEQNPCFGVGALGFGTELIVSKVYKHILRALRAHTSLSLGERIFFELHSVCDDEHAEQLLSIAEELAVDECAAEQLEEGAQRALNLRSAFWDAMYERALAFPAHDVQVENKNKANREVAALGY